MRNIDTKLGRVYYEDGIFILERVFDNLSSLIKEEGNINKKAKKFGFKILDYTWIIEDNPYYNIEKVLDFKEASKIRFKYKLELEYNK